MSSTAPRANSRRYTDDEKREIIEHVCSLIATQARSLRTICDDPGSEIPVCAATIWRWIEADDACDEEERQGFHDLYARAKGFQAEILADEIIAIADDVRGDYVERVTDDGETVRVFDQENVQRSRLKIDSLKWLASKLAPRKYGDRAQVDHHVTCEVDIALRLKKARQQLAAWRGRAS